MRVLIIYNQQVLSDTHAEADSEQEILGTVDAVREILNQEGFEVTCLAVGRNLGLLASEIFRRRPDVVFNLFEGLADEPSTESRVAEILERLDVPFTGCNSWTLRMARSKHETKRIMLEAGLPTAHGVCLLLT